MSQLEHALKLAREDLCYALGDEPNLRIQGTIEFITNTLNDHAYFEEFKKRWNVPWYDGPIHA